MLDPEPAKPLSDLPLRLPIQDVYKFDDRRILAGRIESGRLKVGDPLLFSPSTRPARVTTSRPGMPPASAGRSRAGESIGITLDEQIFVERGEIASHEADAADRDQRVPRPPVLAGRTQPLQRRRAATSCGSPTRERRTVDRAGDRGIIDTDDAGRQRRATRSSATTSPTSSCAPRHAGAGRGDAEPTTGRFVLIDGPATSSPAAPSACGGYPDQRQAGDDAQRQHHRASSIASPPISAAARNGHKGGVLWFTGLSGAGKSTIAMAVEQELFRRGYQVYVLDGDNVRHGLNANLGFSPDDRAENIRRVGEVAAPVRRCRHDRDHRLHLALPRRPRRARARGGAASDFHEVYVKASLATCEKRDPKGLYKKARAGEIREFTGIYRALRAPRAPPSSCIDTRKLESRPASARSSTMSSGTSRSPRSRASADRWTGRFFAVNSPISEFWS